MTSRRVRVIMFSAFAGLVLSLAGCARLGGRRAPASPSESPQAPSEIPVTVAVIDTGQATRLPEGFFGYSADLVGTPLSFDNLRFRRRAKELAPGSLAFPAGDAANCWDWRIGMIREEWIGALAPPTSDTLAAPVDPRIALGRAARLDVKKGGTQIDDFLRFCRKLGAAPFCTANVLNQTPDQTSDWARVSTDLGTPRREARLPATRWQLGWELWKPEYRQALPSAEEYAKRAQLHAQALRAVLPNARIAVDVPVAGFVLAEAEGDAAFPRPMQDRSSLQSWVGDLAGEDFYDAVALDLTVAPRAARNASPQGVLFALATYLGSDVDRACRQCALDFQGREIWAAKWGIRLDDHASFEDSLLHALALADMAMHLADEAPRLAFMRYPSLVRAAAPSNADEMESRINRRFAKTGAPVRTAFLPVRFRNPPPTSHALGMLGGFFVAAKEKVAVDLYQPPRLSPDNSAIDPNRLGAGAGAAADGPAPPLPPALNAMAAIDAKGRLRAAFLNRSRVTVPVRIVVDRQQVLGKVAGPVLWGANLLARAGGDGAGRETGGPGDLRPRKRAWPAAYVELPPYSFSVLEIPR